MKNTGIGSLPHHNIDSALDYSFRHDLPFLPQLPMKNDAEMMVYQTLFNFPGLALKEGKPVLNLRRYVKERGPALVLVDKAFAQNNFDDFLPTPTEYACFAPFLFELEERGMKEAKIQITGHITSSMVLCLDDGEVLKEYPQILSDIFKWTMVKGLAMIKALKDKNIAPILFIDEPILTIFKQDPNFSRTALSETSMLILAFKKAGAKVGLHSCGNCCWDQVLDLPLDFLSFDVNLSGTEIIKEKSKLEAFHSRGGKLALGLLPTQMYDGVENWNAKTLFAPFQKYSEGAIISCACGLGLKSPEKAELFLSELKSFH